MVVGNIGGKGREMTVKGLYIFFGVGLSVVIDVVCILISVDLFTGGKETVNVLLVLKR